MSKLQPQPHLDAIREQLLPLMLADAAFDGWTDAGLQQCAQKLKLDPGAVELAVPRGCIDLIRYWANCNDQAMLDAWAKTKPRLKKIREKAVFLVRSRIVAVGENNREAARRALARLALPGTSGEALAMAWASADAMWRAMNDTSTDYNYYTKRLILYPGFLSQHFKYGYKGMTTRHGHFWTAASVMSCSSKALKPKCETVPRPGPTPPSF